MLQRVAIISVSAQEITAKAAKHKINKIKFQQKQNCKNVKKEDEAERSGEHAQN